MSTDTQQIQAQVRGYILENLMFTDDAGQLPLDLPLLENGIIDSTGVLEIVLFLEERFGVKVADDQMLPQNFDSVEKIAAFVHRLKAAA